jgi:heat-inducible transcriptional repressor
MASTILREKDRMVLDLIVESYLKEGKPVSSGSISRSADFPVSPATVRNIMAKLERNDFLLQPHTSAGRIPTDRGLRHYVNSLFKEAVVKGQAGQWPGVQFKIEKNDFTTVLQSTSRLLSEYSDNIGFVVSPRFTKIRFHYIRFIKIGQNRVMILLVTPSGLVFNEIVESLYLFTQTDLDRASRFINENYPGRNLTLVRDVLVGEVPKYKLRVENSLAKITELLKNTLDCKGKIEDVYLQGTATLLEKPELFEMERLNSLFRSFEEKAKLAKLLSDVISLERVKVLIGSELEDPRIAECSLVLAHYGDKSQVLGSLGIIGPKRIPYKKIIPLVECVAEHLSRTISTSQ